jgi:integrase
VWTRPKSAAGTRIVPIAGPLLVLLLSADRETSNPHNLVWHHPDGRPVSPKEDHLAWREALRSAGFTDPLPNLHAARHTTATLLLKAGVPEQIRMQIMGQSSVVAHRGYAHVDQTLTREAVGHLTQLMIE